MKPPKTSTLILVLILAIFAFFFGNRMAECYINSGAKDFVAALTLAFDSIFVSIINNPVYLSKLPQANLTGFMSFLVILLVYAYNLCSKKNYMFGQEHGSAKWASPNEIKPFIDTKNPDNNIILSETEQLTLASRMPNPLHNRNKNVIVTGGSGKGKTRFVSLPNISQLNTSFVVTDPKMELLAECGKMLEDAGYVIKVLNLEDMCQSDNFNFFEYIHSENDILILVDNILSNTQGGSDKPITDDFWVKSERALLCAIMAFIHFECPKKDRNMHSVLRLLGTAAAREDNEDFKSELDVIFDNLKKKNPACLAVYMYNTFKLGSAKTAKSILISLAVRLAPFSVQSLKSLMETDTLNLEAIGKEKTALFLVVPETYRTFDFIFCVLYQLLFETLYRYAKKQPDRRLPVHVQIIGDEIANIGRIPNLDRYMSTMRSYEISAILIFQSLSQIENMNKNNWKTIVGNCDTFVFLGGAEQSTTEYVSKSLGKTTIDQRNTSESKGYHGSYSLQESTLGRDLLDPAELAKIPNDECIVVLSGLNPFKSKKYPLEKHPRYNKLAQVTKKSFVFSERKTKEEKEIAAFFKNVVEVFEYKISEDI